MDMKQLFQKHPVLAIIRNVPLEDTVDYAKAIVNGGIRLFEVALNSADSYKQISCLRRTFGDEIVLGAGTAITVERAEKAIEAGAEFLLTPSTQSEILHYCRENQISILPGALTPSDVAMCLNYGFDTMKLFPAGDMPMGYINSLKGPFNNTEYVAIGGVNYSNIGEFFKKGFLGVGLGSNLMPKEALKAKDWETCSEYIRQLIDIVEKECR